MQDFTTSVARRYAQSTARLELDALENAVAVLKTFRYSDATACSDGFLSAESVVALKECEDAIVALRAMIAPPRRSATNQLR